MMSEEIQGEFVSPTDEEAQVDVDSPTVEETQGHISSPPSNKKDKVDVVSPTDEEGQGNRISSTDEETKGDDVLPIDGKVQDDADSPTYGTVRFDVESLTEEKAQGDDMKSDQGIVLPMFLTALMGPKKSKEEETLFAESKEGKASAYSPRVDLFREVVSMLDTSVLVASYAALRHLARENKLKQPELILECPVTVSNVIECVHANITDVMSELGDDRYGVFEAFLDTREKRLEESAVRMGTTYAALEQEQQMGVMHFGDEKSNQELVYAINLDSVRKRVIVVFRGTTTKIDLRQDLRAYQQVIENPLKGATGMSDNIRVHFGFYEYLFANERKEQEEKMEESLKIVEEDVIMSTEEKRDRREMLHQEKSNAIFQMDKLQDAYGIEIESKCDLIMSQAISLLEKNPGFELYITGHSMGGALATLFGAVAAMSNSPHVPKPVTCISFSSPKVGNVHFKTVYEKLEQDDLIRKVRVLNGLDPIPKTPSPGIFRILIYALCPWSVLDGYNHVGIELKLKETGYTISYDKHHGVCWLLLKEIYRILKGFGYFLCVCVLCRIRLLRYHSCSEIFARLQENWEALEKEDINSLYQRIKGGEGGVLSYNVITPRQFQKKRKKGPTTKRNAEVIAKSKLPNFSAFSFSSTSKDVAEKSDVD